MREFREAKKGIEGKDLEVFASVFMATPQVCSKMQEIQDIMTRINSVNPDVQIEAFVVPMPKEPEVAYMTKKQVIENVHRLFARAFPNKRALN